MTNGPDLERRLADHYAREAPPRAPDFVLAEALSTIETARQRPALGRIFWRTRLMSNLARAAAAVVVLIVVSVVGLMFLGRSTGTGSNGVAGPSVAPSGGEPSAPPPLTGAFTSSFNGYSISYPGGWKVTKGTSSWPTGSANFSPDNPFVDAFTGPNLAIYAVSQKIDPAIGPTKWLAQYMSDSALDFSNRPDCAVVRTMPITVDGAAGIMNYSCEAVLIDAVVTAGGRAYVFSLQGDSPDKAWLLEVLATVRLHPETAVDASPSATPSTAGSPVSSAGP
ncbi:MAG: hypothetical protein QOI09_716 [Chloroflexota bacterium]|jgi:hypothetical protein|nr:hypothetical protein [Chloroflexota bacterium]